MLSKGTASAPETEDRSLSNQFSTIASGTRFEGTLTSQGDVRISGYVRGKVRARTKVTVSQEGRIEGELQAAQADIAGSVDGDVTADERLVLKATARLHGKISTVRLIVEDGAVFSGECRMKDGSPEGARPEKEASRARV